MNMNKTLLTTAAVLAFSLSTGAQASLVTRAGVGVYDTVNNITWAADANLAQTSGYDTDGKMTWAEAVAWADQLTLGGFTDWMLPTTVPEVVGYNQTGSQMGDLFYNQLGGELARSIANSHNNNYTYQFINVQSAEYWSGSERSDLSAFAWLFNFDKGFQTNYTKGLQYYAWAVRPGDVAAVPVPGAFWLFGSAIVGLMGLKRRGNIG